MTITLKDIQSAAETINNHIEETALTHSRSCSDLLKTEIFLKLENQQKTGSFKIRGAVNKIASLTEEEKSRGVVAASAGNHAQGVALAASLSGINSHIVMPIETPIIKTTATEAYGATVELYGNYFDQSYARAAKISKTEGRTLIHAFDDPLVMAGQGTIGLEVLKQVADLDSIVIPIGGGGLISGIALAIKTLRPSCKVYGVVAAQAPGMKELFTGKSTESRKSYRSIADGITVKKPNEAIFKNYISKYVDDIVEVNEEEIAEAIVFLLERSKVVVEGAGAVTLAACSKRQWDLGKKSVLLLSGGNIDLNLISKVIERGLSQKGRLARVYLVVYDRPGSLTDVTQVLAEQQVNILDIYHDRLNARLEMRETILNILFETKGREHLNAVLKALTSVGRIIDQ